MLHRKRKKTKEKKARRHRKIPKQNNILENTDTEELKDSERTTKKDKPNDNNREYAENTLEETVRHKPHLPKRNNNNPTFQLGKPQPKPLERTNRMEKELQKMKEEDSTNDSEEFIEHGRKWKKLIEEGIVDRSPVFELDGVNDPDTVRRNHEKDKFIHEEILPRDMKCPKHKRYTAQRKPRTTCQVCWAIYREKHGMSLREMEENIKKVEEKKKKNA